MIRSAFGIFLLLLACASGVTIFIRAFSGSTGKFDAMPGLFVLGILFAGCSFFGLLLLGVIPSTIFAH